MTRGDCESIRPLISAALDGELDEDEFVQLSEHLASCDDCHQAYLDYSQLRDELRTASTPTPPSHLTRSIRQETVEKPPPSMVVQLASRVGLRFGATTVAASLVILFALGVFAYLGYDQRTAPSIAASHPTQETEIIQDWPVSQPVEIEFSKPMDKASVQHNLIIKPSSELERLPRSWEGNTLVIGRSDNQSALLKPRTDYTIAILENAKDNYGNQLGETWVLRFRTSPEEVAVNTPPSEEETEQSSETPTQATDDASPTVEQTPAESGDDAGEQADSQPIEDEDVDGSAQTSDKPEPTSTAPAPDPRDEPVEDEPTAPANDQHQEQEQEQEPNQQTPEPTATPKPTAKPSPSPEPTPATTVTPKPEPTAEPTAEPTEPAIAADESTSTSAATPETIPVRGAFGEIYWGNQSVQDALGQPMQEAQSFIAAEQEFQRGLMFRRYHLNKNAIFVFVNGGTVQTRDFTYNPETDDYPGEDLGGGLYAPSAYFGKVWAENPDIAESLGNAVSLQPSENIDGAMQQFTNGQMIYSRGMVYVIYQDWTWESYPAQSGESGGFQHEDSGGDQSSPDDAGQQDGGTGGESTPDSGGEADGESGETELQPTPDETTPVATPEQEEPSQDEEDPSS